MQGASTSQGGSPLVSIVIATNRRSAFLRPALESVVAQTYDNWEVVIVDDGSPIPEALDDLAVEFRQVRVVHQANRGPAIARNVGVVATKGEFVAFLDDDDLWEPRRLESQIAGLLANPAAVAGYCGMRSIDEYGREVYPADQRRAAARRDVLRREVGIFLGNLVVRRSCLDRVGGFHPAFRLAEDLDLVLRVVFDGEFDFVDEVLVDYRTHTGNVTSRRHELVRSITHVVSLHRWAARERGDRASVRDLRASLAANRRFAAWSAARRARDFARRRRPDLAAAELGWGLVQGRDAFIVWPLRRLRKLGRRR